MASYQSAVRKASKARLLADMRTAAYIVRMGLAMSLKPNAFARGFALGAAEATGSLTVRAALLTAFGG